MSQTATSPAAQPNPRPNIPVSVPATGSSSSGVPGPASGVPAPPALKPTGSTPTLLARLRILAVVAVLGVTAGLLASLAVTWQVTAQARADSEQLLRVQGIKVNLLRADALATNAFLIGGLESSEQRAAYDDAISAVSRDIADAADAQPADRAVLEQLGIQVVDFAEAMEQARANNRQGFPVGSAYLAQADSRLRSTALPLVKALVDANTQRSQDSISAPLALIPIGLGLLGAVAVYLLNRRLADIFHRRINLGVAIAGAAVLVLAGASTLLIAQQSTNNSALLDGPYATAVAGAEARSAGNDAKANESLRLIRRGSGASNEEAWEKASAATLESLGRGGLSPAAWNLYGTAHDDLVALDEGGDWAAARELAVSADEDAPSSLFAAFDTEVGEATAAAGKRTSDSLSRLLLWYPILIGLTLLGGLAAAGFASRGITQRLREYE